MKNPINKRLPRELWHNAGRYTGLFLLVMLSVGVVLSFVVSADNIRKTTNKYNEEANLQDGYLVVYQPVGKEEREQLKEQGIELYEDYYKEIKKDGETVRVFKDREI